MRVLLILLVAILAVRCDTENNTPDPSTSYFIRYYGTEGDQEGVDMLVNDDDNTILLLGTSTRVEGGDKQILLTKVDARGNILWERFFGSLTTNETAVDIEPLADGNYVLLINEENSLTGGDIRIIIIDQNGVPIGDPLLGTFTYDVVNGVKSNEEGVSVTPLTDGAGPSGFIVAGHTDFDPVPGDNAANNYEGISALFVRFNNDGTLYTDGWSEHHSSAKDDYCTKVVQVGDLTDDDPFLLFGYTNGELNNPSFNYWVSRLNKNGGGLNVAEGILPGVSATSDELLTSVTGSGGSSMNSTFLLAGFTLGSGNGNRIFIATNKLSLLPPMSIPEIDLGNFSGQTNKILEKVSACASGPGYLIAANSVAAGNSDIILTKVAANGSLLWDSPAVLGGSGDDYVCSVYELNDKRILVFGTVSIGDDEQKKMALIKVNKDGLFK